MLWISVVLAGAPPTIMGLPFVPSACSAAWFKFPIVALIAQVCRPGRCWRSHERHSSVWLPRLLPINSCHSSKITVSRLLNSSSAFGLLSNRVSDSGVVTNISGGDLSCFVRSLLLLSPLRMPTRNGQFITSIGSRIARARSRLSARSGVRYSNRIPLRSAVSVSIRAMGPITAA